MSFLENSSNFLNNLKNIFGSPGDRNIIKDEIKNNKKIFTDKLNYKLGRNLKTTTILVLMITILIPTLLIMRGIGKLSFLHYSLIFFIVSMSVITLCSVENICFFSDIVKVPNDNKNFAKVCRKDPGLLISAAGLSISVIIAIVSLVTIFSNLGSITLIVK